MDFFGIGWLELFFILIIVLLVAGPRDIERGAKGVGRFINKLNRSPSYQAIRRASTELRNLPQRLAREANLEELKQLNQEMQQVKEEVQQVRQELKENTSNIAGAGKAFEAWVKDMPEPPAGQPAAKVTPPPAPKVAAPPATAPNGPAPDPTPSKDA